MLASALTVRFDLMQHYEAEVTRLHESAIQLNTRCQQLTNELLQLVVCCFWINITKQENTSTMQGSTSNNDRSEVLSSRSTDTRKRRVWFSSIAFNFESFTACFDEANRSCAKATQQKLAFDASCPHTGANYISYVVRLRVKTLVANGHVRTKRAALGESLWRSRTTLSRQADVMLRLCDRRLMFARQKQ